MCSVRLSGVDGILAGVAFWDFTLTECNNFLAGFILHISPGGTFEVVIERLSNRFKPDINEIEIIILYEWERGFLQHAVFLRATGYETFSALSNLPSWAISPAKLLSDRYGDQPSAGTPIALSIGVGRIVSISTRLKIGNRMMDCRMKILIEYDGSRRADDAIEDLQNAGLPKEAKIKIVSVVEPIIPTGMPEIPCSVTFAQVTERKVQLSRLAVKEACERLSELFPDWELDNAVYQGKTELAIIGLAAKWKPDLVVISPLNRNVLGRLIFGSLSRSIVERSSCSVRVARPADIWDGSGLRLLIGFDGSSSSEAAVCEVASRQWPKGAQVRLVTGFKSSFDLRSELYDVEEPLLRMRLDLAVRLLRAAGLVVSQVIRGESHRQVILDEAVRFGAHCIFLSGDDRGGFRRLVFGSTAAAVASKARCTVEVVREKKRRLIAIDSGARRKVPRRTVFEAASWTSAQVSS